jgi:hypothetical protein
VSLQGVLVTCRHPSLRPQGTPRLAMLAVAAEVAGRAALVASVLHSQMPAAAAVTDSQPERLVQRRTESLREASAAAAASFLDRETLPVGPAYRRTEERGPERAAAEDTRRGRPYCWVALLGRMEILAVAAGPAAPAVTAAAPGGVAAVFAIPAAAAIAPVRLHNL